MTHERARTPEDILIERITDRVARGMCFTPLRVCALHKAQARTRVDAVLAACRVEGWAFTKVRGTPEESIEELLEAAGLPAEVGSSRT